MLVQNQKGQAFAVYRLLIGAILALMIMFFITGIYAYFEEQRVIISERGLRTAIKNAVSSPNGEVITVENLTFRSGTAYSKRTFASWSAIPAECIELPQTASGARSAALYAEGDLIRIKQLVMLNVYVKCYLQECDNDDETADDVTCEISFGEKLESENE